jgi:hypothetical protein
MGRLVSVWLPRAGLFTMIAGSVIVAPESWPVAAIVAAFIIYDRWIAR